MAGTPQWLRRLRAQQRAIARQTRRQDELATLDARYTEVARAAALHAATHGRGIRVTRRTA